MISRIRHSRQATLLDHYWSALRRNQRATPPQRLNVESAEVVARLERGLAPLPASTDFITRLEQRLDARIAEESAPTTPWRGPALDPAARRAAARANLSDRDERDREAEGETTMSTPAETPLDEPIPIRSRSRAREIAMLAAAAVAFIIVGVVLALALESDDPPTVPAVSPDQTSTPSEVTATVVPTTVVTATSEAVILESPTAAATAASAEPTPTSTIPSVPSPGETIATIRVGSGPQFIEAFAAGSLWVTNMGDSTISRIDVATNAVVATIPVGSVTPPDEVIQRPPTIATWGDQIWVLHPRDHTLMRIDPAANTIATSFSIAGEEPNAIIDPSSLAVSEDALWVTDTYGSKIVRFDPQTQALVATLTDIAQPVAVHVTSDGVWVTDFGSGQLVRIDPATNQIVDRVEPAGLLPVPSDIASDDLLALDGRQIVRIDPATNGTSLIVEIPKPLSVLDAVFDGETAWVTATIGSRWALYRVDLGSGAIMQTLQNDGEFHVAVADGSLWLAGTNPNAIVRIAPTP